MRTLKEMSTILVIFVLVGLLLAVAGFFMQKSEKEKTLTLLDQLKQLPNFHPEKTLIKTPHNQMIPTGVSLDGTSKKICLIRGNTLTLKSFADIVEAQIIIDGKTITKTSRSSQAVGMAVGAVLGGGLGLLVGGLTGSTSTSKQVNNVSIKLLINDLNAPMHEINMIELLSTGKTPVSIALKEAEEWDNIFKVVLFQAKEDRNTQELDEITAT